MSNEIEIEWPDLSLKVTATLLNDRAPKLCKVFLEDLPQSSYMGHVVVSGQSMKFHFPVVCENTENLVKTKNPGDIYFYNNGQIVVIPYGLTTGSYKVNKFAEIMKEDIPKLKIAGEYAWHSKMLNAERWKGFSSPSTPPIKAIFRIK